MCLALGDELELHDPLVQKPLVRFRREPTLTCLKYWSFLNWTRSIIFLVAVLGLRFVAPPAVAQDHADPRDESYDYTIDGVQFRVPVTYMRPSSDPNYQYQHLNFAFWLSDGKPIGKNVPPIGAKERQGPGWYWPPEPGRPYLSKEDFLVFVAEAIPMDAILGLRRQKWPRQWAGSSATPPITREYGLDCRNSRTDAKTCFTQLHEDPDVSMYLQGWRSGNTDWQMKFYSRTDALWVKLAFPDLGQPRWAEVVCRTLRLVRTWRVSGGPAPQDCPTIRVSVVKLRDQ